LLPEEDGNERQEHRNHGKQRGHTGMTGPLPL